MKWSYIVDAISSELAIHGVEQYVSSLYFLDELWGVKDLLFAVRSICSLLNAVCVQISNPYSIETLILITHLWMKQFAN